MTSEIRMFIVSGRCRMVKSPPTFSCPRSPANLHNPCTCSNYPPGQYSTIRVRRCPTRPHVPVPKLISDRVKLMSISNDRVLLVQKKIYHIFHRQRYSGSDDRVNLELESFRQRSLYTLPSSHVASDILAYLLLVPLVPLMVVRCRTMLRALLCAKALSFRSERVRALGLRRAFIQQDGNYAVHAARGSYGVVRPL